MNISKLRNIAWAIFALMLTATTVMGQGWNNGNRSNHNANRNCMSSISGLSEKQQKQIQEMEIKHNGAMAELRTKRQMTSNAIEKSEIRTDMLKKVEAHRTSVKEVLSDEQQKQYELMHTRGNYGQNQKYANGGGNRNFQGRGNTCTSTLNSRGRGGNFQNGNGNRNFQRQGNGNQQFARGNACNSNGNNRGRGGNFQNGNGNRASYGNHGNGSQGQNANYGRGNNRFNSRTNCVGHGSTNVDTCGFKVIEEKEFEE